MPEAIVAIVDDDESFRHAIRALIKSPGYSVETFPSAADFLASVSFSKISCLIADVHMPRMTGIELHNRLVIPTILITAYPDDRVRARALNDGVVCYLSKPCDDDALLKRVRAAFEIR